MEGARPTSWIDVERLRLGMEEFPGHEVIMQARTFEFVVYVDNQRRKGAVHSSSR